MHFREIIIFNENNLEVCMSVISIIKMFCISIELHVPSKYATTFHQIISF
jgi:hypothetical protein